MENKKQDEKSLEELVKATEKGELETYSTGVCNEFQLFGFFKNKEDAKRAIDLFGKEIKELFVDCEG